MFPFAPYLLKSLWRHRARTGLTVSGSAVALFVFCFVGAVKGGLDSLTGDQDTTLIVFQENRFCPATSRLPLDYQRTIARFPGVKQVIPMQVVTNNCRASLDILVMNGVPPGQLRKARDLQLVSGDWSGFERQRDAALVGRSTAKRRNLRTGDTFSMGVIAVKVAGIFASETPAEDSLIYTHLDFLQQTSELDAAGVVTQFEVELTDHADPEVLSTTIDAAFRSGPVATATRLKGAFQASTLADLVGLVSFAHWLGYACIGLVLSLVATTTVMAVQDRVREHAILQTIGLRPARIFRLVLAESMVVCLAGGILGTGLALSALAMGGFAIGAEGVAIAFRPSWSLAWSSLLVATVVGLLAGLAPAIQAARTKIVAALAQG